MVMQRPANHTFGSQVKMPKFGGITANQAGGREQTGIFTFIKTKNAFMRKEKVIVAIDPDVQQSGVAMLLGGKNYECGWMHNA